MPLLLGIGSRESRWGLALRPPGPEGTGDFIRRDGALAPDGLGWGRGLMQIDYQAHEFARSGDWRDPRKNIMYGAKVLHNSNNYLKSKLGDDLGDLNVMMVAVASYHAGVSAYNTGAGNVLKSLREGRSVDFTTHGGDYSQDVLNRARWFIRNTAWANPFSGEPMPVKETLNSTSFDKKSLSEEIIKASNSLEL